MAAFTLIHCTNGAIALEFVLSNQTCQVWKRMKTSANLCLHRSYKSVDGRTTPLLFGTNPSTPQPSSPDTAHFHMLHDYNSVVSPSSPVSPEMLMLSGLHTPGSRDSQRLLSNEDTRCSTPDTYEEMVGSWYRRSIGKFPRIYVGLVFRKS